MLIIVIGGKRGKRHGFIEEKHAKKQFGIDFLRVVVRWIVGCGGLRAEHTRIRGGGLEKRK